VRRVVVVGPWGVGKSTLAAVLAEHLGVPRVEHDPLYWEPGWVPAAPEVFRTRVAAALAGPAWVADGNFSAARELVWRRADTLVWLDYPLLLVAWRLAWRTARRVLTRERLWHGTRETVAGAIGPRSLLWALPGRHACWRREYPALLARPEYAHLRVHRLGSPAEARTWCERLYGGRGA